MKRILLLVMVVVAVLSLGSCAEIRDGFKDFESNTVGLDRDIFVTVDDGTTFVYSGSNIRVEGTEYGNKVVVTIDGKRLAVYNASVQVVERGLEPTSIFAPGELANTK